VGAKKRHAAVCPRAASCRLQLEHLEDRCVPAFLAPVSYAVTEASASLVAADFNNDGVLDLARPANVLLGNADGSFQPAIYTGISYALAAGDFNGDGNIDLAGCENFDLNVFLGNGDGTFQTPHNIPFGETLPVSVSVGDLDADGNLDLAMTRVRGLGDG